MLGLDDVVFHLAITPDRGYCLSVRGMAREIACAYDLDYVDPADVPPLPAEGEALPVTIQPGTGVIRFGLRPVTGIDPTAVSPWWMQRRLLLSGIRAISPAVDVTNYVMLELGHPMHAHDRSLITGGFKVRFAEPGETVVTLDDIERKLDPRDVLIVDDVATAAIGGVMGAGTTEVRDTTTDLMLEAAVWDPAAVSRTQRRLHLTSESGRRYERTVDPAVSVAALDRAATLLADIAGGTIEPKLTDWRGDPPRERLVAAAGQHGRRPAGPHRRRRLRRRHHATQADPGRRRRGDRRRPGDGDPAELAARPARARRPRRRGAAAGGPRDHPVGAAAGAGGRGLTPTQKRRRAIGKSLALNGYVEILPTPFLPAGVFDQWGLPADDPRRKTTQVLNPLESDRPQLATTLLPGLLEALGAQRVPRRRRRRAVRDRSKSSSPPRKPVPSNAFRTTAGPPTRRSPYSTRRCRASRSTSAWSWQACVSRRARGVPAGRWRRAMRSRRCVSSAAPPVSS